MSRRVTSIGMVLGPFAHERELVWDAINRRRANGLGLEEIVADLLKAGSMNRDDELAKTVRWMTQEIRDWRLYETGIAPSEMSQLLPHITEWVRSAPRYDVAPDRKEPTPKVWAPAVRTASVAPLAFHSAGEAHAKTADAESCARVEGLIYERDRVLMVGEAKEAGKSTLAYAVAGALERGVPFAGLRTKQATVFMLSEEFRDTIELKIKRFGITRMKYLDKRSLLELGDLTFPELITRVTTAARQVAASVLLIDTLAGVARIDGDDEQSSGRMLELLEPLAEAKRHFTVITLHHATKSKVAQGVHGVRAVRGSGAIAGAFETVIDLHRLPKSAGLPSTAREISIQSWRPGLPDRLVLNLRENEYLPLVGAGADAIATNLHASILTALAREPTGMTGKQVSGTIHRQNAAVTAALKDLEAQGKVVGARIAGVRGMRFQLAIGSGPVPPKGGEREPRNRQRNDSTSRNEPEPELDTSGDDASSDGAAE